MLSKLTQRKPRQLDWLQGDPRFDWEALDASVGRLVPPPVPPLEPPLRPDAPFELGLVACSASKTPSPAPAEHLYTGHLFRLSLGLARRLCQRVRILSAFHHVVRLDQVLSPYDRSMSGWDRQQRARWANLVSMDLERWRGQRVLCLAPQVYWQGLRTWPGWEFPLKGKGIGLQKAWLLEQAATH